MFRRTTLLLTCLALLILIAAASGIHAQGNFAVAILVVDDFTGVDLSTLDVPESDNACAVSLEGQAFITRGASVGEPISEPHGELVYAELEEMVADLQAEDYITLVKVDVQGLPTDQVAEAIDQAMLDQQADAYVVNMSFALIPCEFITDLAGFEGQLGSAANARNLNEYRNIFQRAVIFYDQTVFPVNSRKFQEETRLDPLQDFLAANNSNVVAIAAAGNFGLDYPFWPGGWGQVVSVSGSKGTGFLSPSSWDTKNNSPLLGSETEVKGKKGTRISNFGEVMLPGEYASDLGNLVGTSFAAPRLSLVVASYLSAVGTDFCRNDDGVIALDSGEWKNLTLSEAAETLCPDLATYIPG